MLLNENIQILYKNDTTVTAKAGEAIILGDTASSQCVLGVTTAEINPGETGILETSGVFTFDEYDITNAGKYQPIYCYKVTGNKVRFTRSARDGFVYAGISLTDRATEGGPLVIALGYKCQVFKEVSSSGTPSPSGGGTNAMGDSSTVVDPSNSSEPGAM